MATLTTNYTLLGQTKLGSSAGDLYIRIYAKYNSQSIENNTTSVTYQSRLYFSGNYIIAQGQTKVVTSGTNVSETTTTWQNFEGRQDGYYYSGETTVKTITTSIRHNSTGQASISASAVFTSAGSWGWSGTASGSADLPTIPRASIIRGEDTDWNTGLKIDYGLHIGITKYASSFYNKLEVLYYNETSQTYTSLKYINDINDGDDITFTSAELDAMYLACLPQRRTYVRLRLYTYSDSGMTQQVGSPYTYQITGTLVTVAPTFLDFDYVDINDTTKNLTKDSGLTIIKGYSTLQVSIPVAKKAIANTRQTDMSHYIIDGNTATYSATNEVVYPINNYNKDNISVYAVDNRNMSSDVVNKSFSALGKYIDYTNVFKNDNQSYSRSDSGVGEFVTLTFSGSWWGNQKFGTNSNAVTNSLTATYKYRVSGASTWVTPTNPNLTLTLSKAQQSDTYYTLFSYNGIVYGDLSTHGFNVSQSYDIMVIVSDELSSVTYNFSIHSGEPAIALYKNKAALGAKYDETLGGTQLWGDAYLNGEPLTSTNVDAIYPVGSIYLTTDDSIDPNNLFTGTTWVQIEDRFLLAAGSTYTAGDTGGSATVTLNANQIPSHSHVEYARTQDGNWNPISANYSGGSTQGAFPDAANWTNTGTYYGRTSSEGGGQAHNNMPPYLVVCMWERTA